MSYSKNAMKFAEQFAKLKSGGSKDMRDSVWKNIQLVNDALASGKAVFERLTNNGWQHKVSGRQNRTVHERGQQTSLALPKGRGDVLHHTWLDILQFLRKFKGSLKLVGCPEYQQAAMLVILYRKWLAEEDSKRLLVGTEEVPVVVEKAVESDADRAAREGLEEEAFEQQTGEPDAEPKMVIEIDLSDGEEWD